MSNQISEEHSHVKFKNVGMEGLMVMYAKKFSERLTKLRIQKGVSAREMSLCLGQNPGYINSIESGRNMPSLNSFFYICEYLELTPEDFFNYAVVSPSRLNELMQKVKRLDAHQLDILIELVDSVFYK